MFYKNFNDPRDVNSFATNYFTLFCFSLFWWSETLNNFLSASFCFFLVISFGISHGALDNEKGKFGRILGTVWAEGTNINERMIEEHMAVRYHGQAKSDIEAEHLNNRTILQEQGKV